MDGRETGGKGRGREEGIEGEGGEEKKSKNTPSVNSCLRPWSMFIVLLCVFYLSYVLCYAA